MAESSWTGPGTIRSRDDISRVLDKVNSSWRETTGTLARAVQTGADAELTLDASRLLPVAQELAPVLPWPGGLLKGATIAAVGSTSLIHTLLAGALNRTDSYACVVNMPAFGVLAADVDYKMPLERLAMVPDAGPDWPRIVGILFEGVAMVVLQPPDGVTEPTMKALQARARERDCVLVSTRPWLGADLVLERTSAQWHGLGKGRGRFRYQEASFRVAGRGRAVRERNLTVQFPPESIAGKRFDLDAFIAATPPGPPIRVADLRPRRASSDKPDLWDNLVHQARTEAK